MLNDPLFNKGCAFPKVFSRLPRCLVLGLSWGCHMIVYSCFVFVLLRMVSVCLMVVVSWSGLARHPMKRRRFCLQRPSETVLAFEVTSSLFHALPFLALPCLILSCVVSCCVVLFCVVLSCLVLCCLVSYRVVSSCLVLSCLVLSCPVLSCLVWPGLVWSGLVWSGLVLSCLALLCRVLCCSVHTLNSA